MTSHGITSTLRRPGVSSSVAHGRRESAPLRTLIMMDGSIALLAVVVIYIGAWGRNRAAWSDEVYVIVTMAAPLPWVIVLALSGGHRLLRGVSLAEHRLRWHVPEDLTGPSCHVDRRCSAPGESWP
jgi:hypothetical protein